MHGLSLPEEFALLSITREGRTLDAAQATVGCAAAELGELVLRGKVLLDVRKRKVGGYDVYRTGGETVRVVDAGPSGLDWADALTVELGLHAAEHGKIKLRRWLRHRRDAFPLHRNALVQRGALRHEPVRRLDHYLPDTTLRGNLIADLGAASSGMHLHDAHMLLLSDLVVSTGLARDLGVTFDLRQRLNRGRGGGAVALLPEALLDASAMLAAAVPKRSRRHG